MEDQPLPTKIKLWCKATGNQGRIEVTLDNGDYIGRVEYDVEIQDRLPLLADAFRNAVASVGQRVQPVRAATLDAIGAMPRTRLNGK